MSKAIELIQNGGVEVLRYADVPQPELKENQILVKNCAIGVNFFDTYQRSGLYKVNLPWVLGQEGAGVVVGAGSGVTLFSVNDRVTYISQGAYAEYTAVNEIDVIKIADNISYEEAASSIYQGLTAYTMMRVSHKVQEGEWVLIHAAAGGVGLMLVQLCKHFGATVIGTTSSEEKANLAKEFGADYIINYSHEDVAAHVLELTDNRGVNAVFDGVGKDTFEASVKSCAILASLVTFGNASGVIPPVDLFVLMPKAIRLMRTAVFTFITGHFRDYAEPFLKLMSEGHVKAKIFKEYSLKDVGQAHSDLEGRRTTGKLILRT